jgi:hypothetical protein
MNKIGKKILAGLFVGALSFKPFAQSHFIIQSGTELKLWNGNYIVLENSHLVNNGTVNLNSGNGTFKFSGSTNTNISGTNKPVFNNIELAKPGASQLILQRDVDVWGSILFTSGILNLNNHILDLGKFGSLSNESEASHIIGPAGGYVQWSDVLNAPSSVNPGNLGAILTTTQNLGTTTIRRGHVSQTNGAGTGSSILRYYDIIPTNNSSLNATLRFTYLDAELNGLSEPLLTVWKSTNLTSWSNVGFDLRNTTTNYVEKNAISDFSRWTLSTPGNALPVHFGVFNTKCNGSSVTIKWTTETEINTKYFEGQRSVDGMNWITISSLFAAGNVSTLREYSFVDNASLQNNFYRIAEVDMDGRINYSTVNKVRCDDNSEFKLWPNPAINQAWLSVNVITDEKANLKIRDGKGRVVYKKSISLFAGNNIVSMDTRLLSGGVYLVELTTGQTIKFAKLIKL